MAEFFLPFSELSPQQVMDMLRLRQQVFVIEQDCIYEDIDGADPSSYHLLMYDDEILCSYLRYFEPGIKFDEACLGRIVVDSKYRGGSTGKKLIQSGIDYSKKLFPSSSIRIEAQAALVSYYNQFGFREEGSVYVVDEIDHIQMVLT